MGVDVYLRWDGITAEEKEAQYTGYAIDCGHVGYLRASMGMSSEIRLIDALFPEPAGPGGYDFCAHQITLESKITNYLIEQDADEMKDIWAKSLRDFFALGVNLQQQGKNPTVVVS